MIEPQNLEDRVRAAMQAVAASASPPEGLSARLIQNATAGGRGHWDASGRGRRGRWQRWAVPMIAAGFALTAVAMVALVRGRTGTAERPSGPLPAAVVPWNPKDNQPMSVAITEPTSLPVPGGKPAAPVIGAPQGTRLCTSADLKLISSSSRPTSDLAGWVTTQYTLRSRATSDCAISAYGVGVMLIDANGRALPQDAVPPRGGPLSPDSLLVHPGQFISSVATWAYVSGSGPRPVDLVITLGASLGARPNTTLSIPVTGVPIPTNPANNSNRGPWRSGWYPWRAPSVSDQGSPSSLTAVIHAPQNVIGGNVLRYTVELQNRTDTAVSLRQCPEVIQRMTVFLQKQAHTVGVKGLLNCASAPAISAHSSTTFAFQLDTTGLVTGQGTLRWQLTKGAYSDVDTITEVKITP
jgi:hypothetical protein